MTALFHYKALLFRDIHLKELPAQNNVKSSDFENKGPTTRLRQYCRRVKRDLVLSSLVLLRGFFAARTEATVRVDRHKKLKS